MVKIDFDRPGLDDSWGATYKYFDGFPTNSTAADPPSSSAESEEPLDNEEAEVLREDLLRMFEHELHPEEDFEPMTILAEDLTSGKNADSELESKDIFEEPAVPVENLADDENFDMEHNTAPDSEPVTQCAPVGDQILGRAAESEKIPVEEWQQKPQEATEPKTEFQQHQLAIEEEPTSTTKRRRLDCFSFLANLFKPSQDLPALTDGAQPDLGQMQGWECYWEDAGTKPDLGQALLPAAASDLDRALLESMQRQISTGSVSDFDRVLLESASFNEAKELSVSLARVRLQDVMEKYHAKVRPVEADGNCQFRALALQLHGDEDQHGKVRAQLVQWLGNMKERYSDFVHEPYDDYLRRMASDGEWGDNVTLQAASDMLCRDIHILNDQPGGERISVHPAEKADADMEKPLWLAFLAELHYDSVEFL